MKDYLAYSVEDFVTDESYLRYYYKENEEDARFWTDWIRRHPEKLDVVISADNYIGAFAIRLSEPEFLEEQQRFTDTLQSVLRDNSPLYIAGDEDDELLIKETKLVTKSHSGMMKSIAIIIGIILFTLGGVYLLFN